MAPREKVFVARVRGYEDAAAIADAVRRGLDFLGWKPPARLVGKANWVLAHEAVARSCYTRPEFLKGALTAILERNEAASIDLIGNSGAGVPTRVVARRAAGNAPEFQRRGAFELERIFKGRVRIRPTDGHGLARYRLEVGGRLDDGERRAIDRGEVESTAIDLTKRYWPSVTTSACLRDAEAFILFPKLKSNVLSHGLTGAVKLQGIGLLLDEARMEGHNYHNHRRMVDMLEVAEPDLIVTDGIEIALGGNQMTERGHPLNVVVMATNAVAHDAVLARILNLRPEEIEHLKIAADRAYGPLWADEVEVGGDVKIGELNARVRSFGENGFVPVTEFPAKFERETRVPFPLEVLAEPPWDVAGVHGLVLDWLYMTYDFRERRKWMAAWPAATIIVGGFASVPQAPAHDRVLVIGDLAIEAWRRLGWGGLGLTTPRWIKAMTPLPSRVERFTRPDGRKGWAWLLAGDPPTHRDLIIGLALATRLRVRTPLMRLDLVLDSYVRMLVTTVGRFLRNPSGPVDVEASSIARLAERKAARRALLEARRAREGDAPRETPSWAPPVASPSARTKAQDPDETLRAPIPSPATPPPPSPAMVAMSALDTQDEIKAALPSSVAIPAPTEEMIALAGEATVRVPVVDPGHETTKLLASEIAEAVARSSAPALPPPPDPSLAAGKVPPPVDFAGFTPATGGALPAAVLAPPAASAATPHDATGRLERAAVEAAVDAAVQAAKEPPAKDPDKAAAKDVPPPSKQKAAREKVGAKGGGKGKGKKRR